MKNTTRYTTYMNRANGFTLIELLIVIAIISILTLVGLIGYHLQITKSYDTVKKQNLNDIKVAFEHYYSDQGCYPPANSLDNCEGNQLLPYLSKVPCDPETGQPYLMTVDPPTTCAQKFFIHAQLSNENDPGANCPGQYVVISSNVTQSEFTANCNL